MGYFSGSVLTSYLAWMHRSIYTTRCLMCDSILRPPTACLLNKRVHRSLIRTWGFDFAVSRPVACSA